MGTTVVARPSFGLLGFVKPDELVCQCTDLSVLLDARDAVRLSELARGMLGWRPLSAAAHAAAMEDVLGMGGCG